MSVSITNLGYDHFKYVPTTTLVALGNTAAAEKTKLNKKLSQKRARLDKLTGETSVIHPSGGRAAVRGFGSMENSIKTASDQAIPVQAMTTFFSNARAAGANILTADNANSIPGGSQQDANTKIDEIISTLQPYFDDINLDPSSVSERSDEASLVMNEVADLKNKVRELDVLLDDLEKVSSERAGGTIPEPEIRSALLDGGISSENYVKFVQDKIVFPFEENLERFKALIGQIQVTDPNIPTPMFDLVYGPPVSVEGQFVLSRDGLYYDSRTGGLPEISGVTVAADSWTLQFPPNIGGKGEFYTSKTREGVENTVLDYDYQSNAPNIKRFEDSDDILQTFEKDKAYHTRTLSGQISELLNTGYSSDSALVINYYQNIAAVASTYDSKIKKRKKQLQLVALFGMDVYSFTDIIKIIVDGEEHDHPLLDILGPGVLVENRAPFDPAVDETDWHQVDRVPINNFKFLRGKPIDLPLEEQARFVLMSEDLDDTLLPLQPKFLVTPPQKFSYLDKFSIDSIATTDFVRIDGSGGVSGTGPFVKSLVDDIVTSGLILSYNFTEPNVVDASSTVFNLDNVIPDGSGFLNGQLVGSSVDYVFPSGLSIPKLSGTYFNRKNQDAPAPLDNTRIGGCYVRLPNNWDFKTEETSIRSRRLEDMMSKTDYDASTGLNGGFAFDFWLHMPNFTMTDDHRYRLVLANENSGGGWGTGGMAFHEGVISNRLNKAKRNRPGMIHGMLLGFRDKGGSSTPSGLEFCVLPTVSQNQKNINNHLGGDHHSVCIAEKYTRGFNNDLGRYPVSAGINELGFKCGVEATTTKGVTLKDASSSFCHFAVSLDYVNDLISVYMDGYLLSSGGFQSNINLEDAEQWGGDWGLALSLGLNANFPGQASYNNPSYNGPDVGQLGSTFTPWILGGGFTDNIATSGFLGANTNDAYDDGYIPRHAGAQHSPAMGSASKSGLDGFIGSFKVYDKPLTSSEALQNFRAQKGYFKNISV